MSIHAEPAQNARVVARLQSVVGIQINGEAIWSGREEWVPVTVSGTKGWVRRKHLAAGTTPARPASESAAASKSLPAVDLSIPSDWKPHSREWTRVYGAAANGDIDEARRRLVRGEGSMDDLRYGWADYLHQQQRIRFWTPIVIAAGITLADAMLKADPGPSRDENQRKYEDNKAAIEYDRQRREESARRDAEARANAERAPY